MGVLFSPGKLLLTSEYAILDGALALAIPTKVGQDFKFVEVKDGNSIVFWEAFHQNKLWLKAKIDYKNWNILETNLPKSAIFIAKVLKVVQEISKIQFQNNSSYYLCTNLEFPADYGLGSSSTLMNNLASWAKIDAFILNDEILGGSGYDVAVAQQNSAILFNKINAEERKIEKVHFEPPFCEELIFIHLNQKQDSREGIALYKSKNKSIQLINKLSEITKKIVLAKSLVEFSELMTLHEHVLSVFLELPTAKEKYFSDCPTFIKSLGAWGGDFILTSKFENYEIYFKSKGFTTILSWQALIR